MAGLTLDSGALIAYERGDERVRGWLEVSFERDRKPTIPSVVVAETYRGSTSARIAQLLKASTVESLDESLAREAGALRGRHSGSGTIDAVVVASAAQRGDLVLTSDPTDLEVLAADYPGVTIQAI